MFTVKFLFMEYTSHIPMHLIGCGDNRFGDFCTSGLNNSYSLSQNFIIF